VLSPWQAVLALGASLTLVFGVIEEALHLVLAGTFAPSLHVAVFFVGFDVGLGAVLLWAVSRRLALEKVPHPGGPLPSLSVLVAAYDEVGVIVETVRSIAAQGGVEFEIIVGDDGSTDGTSAALCSAFSLREDAAAGQWVGQVCGADGSAIPLRVLCRPHAGKGATLNAAAAVAKYAVLITLDADTVPTRGAFLAMARAFVDPAVDSAAGVVTVRNGRTNSQDLAQRVRVAKTTWLLQSQHAEYEKNAIVRIGWSALGALEQVPGAFTGVRTRSFMAVGGFPEDSLTEDYELTYRLVDHGVRTGRVPVIITVPAAQVLTDGPPTLRGFIRQRTRWFAGFLTTLARFRHLIGAPAAAAFGLVRLPLKVVDAVLPIVAFGTLVVLGKAGLFGLIPASHAAALLFTIRWIWDLFVYAMAERYGRRLGDPAANTAVHPHWALAWLCTATEALTYVWLKHLATLRAYLWAARRINTWERSRGSRTGLVSRVD
jgi:cellulose synthase/poly-beta-1,6-N-acetylglucosamine synthase-like glycosyltransferase